MQDLIIFGIQTAQSGDLAQAQKILRRAVIQHPDSDQAWLWLGRCLDDPERRVYCFQRALSLNPANAQAEQELATALPPEASPQPEPVDAPAVAPERAGAVSEDMPISKEAPAPAAGERALVGGPDGAGGRAPAAEDEVDAPVDEVFPEAEAGEWAPEALSGGEARAESEADQAVGEAPSEDDGERLDETLPETEAPERYSGLMSMFVYGVAGLILRRRRDPQ